MSENNEQHTPPPSVVNEPVAIFNGGNVRVLMLLHGPAGGPREPIFQIILSKPDGLEGAPGGSVRLPDLSLLHHLIGEALHNAISATTAVLTPKKGETPKAEG